MTDTCDDDVANVTAQAEFEFGPLTFVTLDA
jgi:hypothetical protein